MILKIDDIAFMMTGPFSERYTNNMSDYPGQFSHPPVFLWMGGKFEPISFALDLVVDTKIEGDSSSPPASPGELVSIVEKLMNKSLPPDPWAVSVFSLPDHAVKVSVGSWWTRTGYLQDMQVEWKPPWDIDTGMPMAARISVTFLSDFLALASMKDPGKLPRKGGFKFNGN